MNATRIILATATFAAAVQLLFAGPPQFDLTWHTMDGGGGTSVGGMFELSGTIGQPDAGVTMTDGTFEVVGGFWVGAGEQPIDPCLGDIAPQPNGDGQVNVDDLLAVINGWGTCAAPCPPACSADIAPTGGDCTVNVDDLLAVINAWGPCK